MTLSSSRVFTLAREAHASAADEPSAGLRGPVKQCFCRERLRVPVLQRVLTGEVFTSAEDAVVLQGLYSGR